MDKVWRQSLETVLAEIGEADLRAVLTRLRPVAKHGDALIVEAPNALAADVVSERCLGVLQSALEQASDGELRRLSLTYPRGSLTQRLGMGSLTKVAALYDKPFWREKGLNGTAVSTDGLVSATFDPDAGGFNARS